MRIGVFTNNYLPNPYGVSTSVDGFRRGLVARGHDVTIFAPEWRGSEGEDDPCVVRYPSIDVPTKVPFSLALPFSPEIDAQIDAQEFDIIHAQHPNILGAQALRWARQKKIPLVFTWHSLYDRYAHYAPMMIPEKVAAKWVMQNAQTFAHAADHIIFPTQSVYDMIGHHEFSEEKVSIIPSGVDEDLFAGPDPQRVRRVCNIPEEAVLLVSISRLTQEKNVVFLAESLVQCLRENSSAYFILAGAGDLTDELRSIFMENGIWDRVVMPGKIDRSDVKNYLHAADIFVYASTSETQGTVLTEALYCGTPVVAVRAPGVRDVVRDGETGILTEEVHRDLAFAITSLIRDEGFHESLSVSAREHARKNYTVTVCSAKLEKLYESILDPHRA